jgi:hypothetical protein
VMELPQMDVRPILLSTYITAALVEHFAPQHQIAHRSAREGHALLNATQDLQIATTFLRTDARSIPRLILVTVAHAVQFVLAATAAQLARLETATLYAIRDLGTATEVS